MRIYILIFAGLFLSIKTMAQTGIGTITPINKFEVVTSSADPASSGLSANGHLRIGPSSGIHVLDFGLSSSSTYGWLQARSRSDYSINYNFLINPNGGRVGIGTSSPSSTLTVGNAVGTIAGEITLNPNSTQYEGGQINIKKSLIGSTADWMIDQYGTSSSDARLRIFNSINETNGMAFLENGNVGIANLAPTDKLIIGNTYAFHDGGDKVLGFGWSPGSGKNLLTGYSAEIRLNPTAGRFSIGTDATSRSAGSQSDPQRRMTITSQGNVGIGLENPSIKLHVLTSDAQSVYVQSNVSDNNGMVILNANTNQGWANNYHEFIFFQNQGTNIGSIVGSNGGNMVSYNTSSDYRLKTDLKNFNGLDLINKVKTYDYSWKRDSSRMYGVMAHELQEVIPYAVSGQKDAVDADGKIIPQSVDYSKLTPILVKALQEQGLLIKQLQKKVQTLEHQIHNKKNKK